MRSFQIYILSELDRREGSMNNRELGNYGETVAIQYLVGKVMIF